MQRNPRKSLLGALLAGVLFLTLVASDALSQTATFTSTPTVTRTNTFTSTPTRTLTGSVTSTATRTRTFTSTPTPTFTFTATVTATRTRTRTSTYTQTYTFTATMPVSITFTTTPTRTPTPTVTPTPTPTRTYTPTRTDTPGFPASVTVTPPLDTPTRTYTPTWTRTYTPYPTPTTTEGIYPEYQNDAAIVASAIGCSPAVVEQVRAYRLTTVVSYILMRLTVVCGCTVEELLVLRQNMAWDDLCGYYGISWADMIADLLARLGELPPEMVTAFQLFNTGQYQIAPPGSEAPLPYDPPTPVFSPAFKEVCQ